MPWSAKEIAERVLRELRGTAVITLGPGLPARIADLLDASQPPMIFCENGVLGAGPKPSAGKGDPDVTDATGAPITLRPGGAYLDAVESFSLIRGGHVDVCVLTADQVDQDGNLAGGPPAQGGAPGGGGAADLAAGARRLIVAMEHSDGAGRSRLLDRCTSPLIAAEAVGTVVTNLGVFKVAGGAFLCVEIAPGTRWEDVVSSTAGTLLGPPELGPEVLAEPSAPSQGEDDEEGGLVAESDWEEGSDQPKEGLGTS